MSDSAIEIPLEYLSICTGPLLDSEEFKNRNGVYRKTNLWNEKYAILIKEFYSFHSNGRHFIHIVFKHLRRRKIDKVRIYLFADHGPKKQKGLLHIGNTACSVDPLELKRADFGRYVFEFRKGVYYYFDVDIKNPSEDTICNCLDIPLNESVNLKFTTMLYHEQSFLNPNVFARTGAFVRISNEEANELEKEKLEKQNRRKTNRTTDQDGTSEQEQALFYNIKCFFDDAVNRMRVSSVSGRDVEADIYIPSIQVAIEYDGLFWHKNKENADNEKNANLNNMQIFVIRVRDYGLPLLSDFNGVVFIHGKAPTGYHMNEIIEQIIHLLSGFVPDGTKKKQLNNFELPYERFLAQRPAITALLFKKKKKNNFSLNSTFEYWDTEKNYNLDPECLEEGSVAYAWFSCPKGNSIIGCIRDLEDLNLFCTKHKTTKRYCIYSICPFVSLIGGYTQINDCVKGCSYIEPLLNGLIEDYINNGLGKYKLDYATLYEISFFPRIAFELLKRIVTCDEDKKILLEEVFISPKNVYNGSRKFVSEFIKLEDIKEIETIYSFNAIHPEVSLNFNLDIFDKDDFGRQAFMDYLLKIRALLHYVSIEYYTRNSQCVLSEELNTMLSEFEPHQSIYEMHKRNKEN